MLVRCTAFRCCIFANVLRAPSSLACPQKKTAEAVDRDGVDAGKELPKVDRALAIQQAKTTTVGYDARRKKNISTFMGLARYERTLGKKCGVGLQTYVHLQHHLGILFLFMIPFFLPQMVYWAANKSFEISKFKFKFPRARNYELIRARSRLDRSQILKVNTR